MVPSLHVHPAFASNHRTNYTTTSREGKPPLQYPASRSTIPKMVAIPAGSGILQSMMKTKGTTMSNTSNPTKELVAYVLERQASKGMASGDAANYTLGYLCSMLEEACRLSPKVRKEVESHLRFVKTQ